MYYHMSDIIPLLGLPAPPSNRKDYYIQCPCCDQGKQKHMNINLVKDVFRCPRCGVYGGVFDLYSLFTGVDVKKVRDELNKVFQSDDVVTRQKRIQKNSNKSIPVTKENPITDIETRDKTYRALFQNLSLASDHKENLLKRGLSEEAIERFGFKTTPIVGHQGLARTLQSQGHYLAGVPAFYRNSNDEWTLVKTKRGILTPVLDIQGRYQGVQIRMDDVKKRKFRWWSSGNMPDGCKVEGWVHLAGPVCKEILLIEGPMKANIVHHLTGRTVLAVPGANALTQLETALLKLKKLGVQRVMTTFDMDYLNNWYVQNGYWEMLCMLDKIGFSFGTYLWHPDYNGLDDYVWEFLMGKSHSAT